MFIFTFLTGLLFGFSRVPVAFVALLDSLGFKRAAKVKDGRFSGHSDTRHAM